MQPLWNRATYCIFIGIVLQSFCAIKLVWLNPLLTSVSGEMFSLNDNTTFMCAWAVVTFSSRILGGYTLGKYAETKGFLSTQKILNLGYIITTVLFFLCCLRANNLYQIKPFILFVVFANAFLFPATLILPAMYLMKIYSRPNHVRISGMVFLTSILGYILSYFVSNKCHPKMMCCIICGVSLLAWFIYYLGKKSLIGLEKLNISQTKNLSQNLPKHRVKILAALVGGVCGAGVTHNYFFVEPYALNVLVVNTSNFKLEYMFFYIALVVFLILAIKVCDYVDSSKLMFVSLICVLFMALGLNVFDVSSAYAYIVYQIAFAFFFSGFLAPSLALIFSLFKSTQPFLNGIIWYYSALSASYLGGYFLSKSFGIFQHYSLLVSPLFLIGVLCLTRLYAARSCASNP